MRPRRRVVDSVLAFWAKVDRSPGDDCWEWRGSRDVTGYGIVRLDGQLLKAHRVAWMLANGHAPGLRLRHVCGNASCVRPDHLVTRSEWGTAIKHTQGEHHDSHHPTRDAHLVTSGLRLPAKGTDSTGQ